MCILILYIMMIVWKSFSWVHLKIVHQKYDSLRYNYIWTHKKSSICMASINHWNHCMLCNLMIRGRQDKELLTKISVWSILLLQLHWLISFMMLYLILWSNVDSAIQHTHHLDRIGMVGDLAKFQAQNQGHIQDISIIEIKIDQ